MMNKFLYPAIALLPIGTALYFSWAQQTAENANSAKLAFSIHAEAFYGALLEARDKSLCSELGPDRWAVRQSGQTLRRGEWKSGERLGTNIPGGRLCFGADGACRAGQGGVCGGEGAANPAAIAVTSDANRIYTITFDGDGRPLIGYDDF